MNFINYSVEFSRATRIFKNRFSIYLLIFIIGFLLQRQSFIDIPMHNDDGRFPLKFTDKNILINSLFHSFVLVFCIFLIEIFYKECLN